MATTIDVASNSALLEVVEKITEQNNILRDRSIAIKGDPGKDGVIFTPIVSADGTLSWTNDGGLANPEPVNIVDNVESAVADALDITRRINLFNKDDERIIQNKYFLGNGNISDGNNYSITHPIKVLAGHVYKMPFSYSLFANNTACRIEDENGDYVKCITGVLTDTKDFISFTFDKDYIVRFNTKRTTQSSFMVTEESDYPDTYIPYGVTVVGVNIGDNNNLTTNNKTSLVNAINEINAKSPTSNPLLGKKLSVNGDSICYGAGYTGGYAKIIGENNNMIVQNIAVSGGTIAAEQYHSSSGNARHWICRTIENMDIDADYAILEGGINDTALSVPLGVLTSDYNGTFDDTTFYGAFESMLKQLITRFEGKKIGYIAVHQILKSFRAINEKENSYYWAAKVCCEKWGVPFLDLNSLCPPFNYFDEASGTELYSLKTTYTHNGDGWHPNEEGYKKYYVPKIEAWLRTL